MRQRDGSGGDARRLRGGLGDDGVAGGERGGDLAEEDREREVPRRDAGEHAAPRQPQLVPLPSRAGEERRHEVRARLGGIIAAEIDRLANLAEGVGNRFARLVDAQRHKRRAVAFEQVGEPVENARAGVDRGRIPCGEGGVRGSDGGGDVGRSVTVVRVLDVRALAEERIGFVEQQDVTANLGQHRRIRQVQPARIDPPRKQVTRQRNARMATAADARDLDRRVGEERRVVDTGVGQLMNEARVRAIFEQAADEIREQVAVPADGGVAAAGIAFVAHQALVQPIAHPMEALEFECRLVRRPVEDRRDRQRIMRREGRKDIRAREHFCGAGEIRYVGRGLAGEQRIVGKPLDLRAFYLAVPVCALDQPHPQGARGGAREVLCPVDHRARPLAIRLHRHAEPVPPAQLGVPGDGGDDVEAHLQPLALLGVDRQPDPRRHRRAGETAKQISEFGNARRRMGRFVARVERRQLDRDRVAVIGGTRADPADRGEVAVVVTRRVVVRSRRLAQHVETR